MPVKPWRPKNLRLQVGRERFFPKFVILRERSDRRIFGCKLVGKDSSLAINCLPSDIDCCRPPQNDIFGAFSERQALCLSLNWTPMGLRRNDGNKLTFLPFIIITPPGMAASIAPGGFCVFATTTMTPPWQCRRHRLPVWG
jgi:hypothetical protein